MRVVLISLFATLLLGFQGVLAQNTNGVVPVKHQQAAIEILKAMGKVRENARMKNDIEAYRYRRLFTPDAMVANEVLPSNDFNKQITLDQYVYNMIQYDMGGTMNTYEFRPYNLHFVEEKSDGTMIFELDVIKEFGQLSTENLLYRSSMDLHYVVEIDKGLEKVLIKESKLNKPKGKFLRVDLSEKLAGDKSFNRILMVNGDSVKVEEGKTVMLRDVQEDKALNIGSTSEEFLGSFNTMIGSGAIGSNGRLNNEIVTVNFRPKRFYLGASFQLGQFTDNLLVPKSSGGSEQASGNMDVNDMRGFLGYRFLNKKDRLFLSIDLQAGIRSFSGSYSANGHRSTYESTDNDGDFYTHHTNLQGITESVSASVLYGGIGVNARYKIWKYLSGAASLSYNMGVSSTGEFDFLAQSASYWGRYEQYGGLALYDIQEYGFVSDQTLETNSASLVMAESPSWIEIGGAIDVRLTQKLSLEIEANYNLGQSIFEAELGDNILSREVDQVNSSMLNAAESRSWNFLSYGVSVRYYL